MKKNDKQKQNEDNKQHHKNLLEALPSKYDRWEFLTFDYKLKKNIDNKWCFNNKNVFTAVELYR